MFAGEEKDIPKDIMEDPFRPLLSVLHQLYSQKNIQVDLSYQVYRDSVESGKNNEINVNHSDNS